MIARYAPRSRDFPHRRGNGYIIFFSRAREIKDFLACCVYVNASPVKSITLTPLQ